MRSSHASSRNRRRCEYLAAHAGIVFRMAKHGKGLQPSVYCQANSSADAIPSIAAPYNDGNILGQAVQKQLQTDILKDVIHGTNGTLPCPT